ncbi:signal protein PDZ [Halioxenophilus aromaticivorans]|uniref:Signal protein PDZ n=1 Tax=Halioxenophilus aromaticivorans TaxID=1306992 RepID=A0AAV3U8M7_9ALTE
MQPTVAPLPHLFYLVICLFGILWGPASNAGVSQWTDVSIRQGHIYVPVSIGSAKGWALLDTGAEIFAINKRLIANDVDLKEGVAVNIAGVYGNEKRKVYNDVLVDLFGSTFEWSGLVDADLGDDLLLVVGESFFNQLVVQMDYPNQRIRIMTHDAVDLKKSENIRLRKKKYQQPQVLVTLGNNKKEWLLFDTGFNGGVMVTRRMATMRGWIDPNDQATHQGRGAVRSANMIGFTLPEVTFGPFTLENVLGSTPAKGAKLNLPGEQGQTGTKFKKKSFEGIVGYDVFKHFVITMDFKNQRMHVGLPTES